MLAGTALPPAARPLIELLRDCYDWRFGAEVRIGHVSAAASAAALADDDIAVSPDAGPGDDGPC
jgi:hypothetical protein